MFKKKIVALTIFLLMTISSVCFADDRWFLLNRDSNGSSSLDTTRVILYAGEKDTYYLDCWIKLDLLKEDATTLQHTYIKINNLRFKEAEFFAYKEGIQVETQDLSNQGWKSPALGSNQEKTIINTISWGRNNQDKIIVR